MFDADHSSTIVVVNDGDGAVADGASGADGGSDGGAFDAAPDVDAGFCASQTSVIVCDEFEGAPNDLSKRGWEVITAAGTVDLDTTHGVESATSVLVVSPGLEGKQTMLQRTEALADSSRFTMMMDFAMDQEPYGITFASALFGDYGLRVFAEPDHTFAFDEFNLATGVEIKHYDALASFPKASSQWHRLRFEMDRSNGSFTKARLYIDGQEAAVADALSPSTTTLSSVLFQFGNTDAPPGAARMHFDNVLVSHQ